MLVAELNFKTTWRHRWPGWRDGYVYNTSAGTATDPRRLDWLTLPLSQSPSDERRKRGAAPSPSPSSCSCRCKRKGAVPRQSAGPCTRRVVAAAAAVTCNVLRVQSDAIINRVNVVSRAPVRRGPMIFGVFFVVIITIVYFLFIFFDNAVVDRSIHFSDRFTRTPCFQLRTKREITISFPS